MQSPPLHLMSVPRSRSLEEHPSKLGLCPQLPRGWVFLSESRSCASGLFHASRQTGEPPMAAAFAMGVGPTKAGTKGARTAPCHGLWSAWQCAGRRSLASAHSCLLRALPGKSCLAAFTLSSRKMQLTAATSVAAPRWDGYLHPVPSFPPAAALIAIRLVGHPSGRTWTPGSVRVLI